MAKFLERTEGEVRPDFKTLEYRGLANSLFDRLKRDHSAQADGWRHRTTRSGYHVIARGTRARGRSFLLSHHLELPNSNLNPLFQASNPGGRLILIDFERAPKITREWVLRQVRAGKLNFKADFEAVGFTFLNEFDIAGRQENYFLVFSKPRKRCV